MKLYLAAFLGSVLTGAAVAAPSSYRVAADCGGRAGCFGSVQAALDAAARDRSGEWVTITIAPGTYREKPVVRRDKVRIAGAGADRTRIVFDAVAQTAGRYDPANWGTPGSATLTIHASDVVVRNVTVENDFDYLANDALPEGDPKKIGNSQGVALLLDTDSDRVQFDGVSLLGYQDTLFTRGRRAWFRRGVIAGNVDFIFGNGMLLIEDSEIRSRRRALPTPKGDFASFITAPSTPLSQPIGIVISRSRLTRERGVEDGSVALGRPWHPTTRFADGRYADPNAVGHAAFLHCWMDRHIHPSRWTSMAGTARDGTKTAIFRAEDSRFSEAESKGPGAAVQGGRGQSSTLTIGAVRARLFEGWIVAG
ncbi:pectinesterase family protein [Sphingomonas sp.]|uniref:pectinesterase family protein n=1 Tax=Sphingomonas sp. TaxID=28214 RepID=UPI002FD8D35E